MLRSRHAASSSFEREIVRHMQRAATAMLAELPPILRATKLGNGTITAGEVTQSRGTYMPAVVRPLK